MRGTLRASIALAGLLLVLVSPAWASVGRIKTVAGSAVIIRGGATLPAVPGTPLEPGDVLATGKDGRLGIAFTDNSRAAIGPKSKITIGDLKFDKKGAQGTVVTGAKPGSPGVAVAGKTANSNREAMRVKTPTSILGVRGTKFVIDVEGKVEDKDEDKD